MSKTNVETMHPADGGTIEACIERDEHGTPPCAALYGSTRDTIGEWQGADHRLTATEAWCLAQMLRRAATALRRLERAARPKSARARKNSD